jgi:copper(I)-binding protein
MISRIHAARLTLGASLVAATAFAGAFPGLAQDKPSHAPAGAATHESAAPAAGDGRFTQAGITVEQPWSRATAKGARIAGGYLRVVNNGDADDVFLAGATDIAERVEVHEMAVIDNVMRMRPVDGGLVVKAGESVELKPGGYHVMFIGLKRPLREKETFTADLEFRDAGTSPVTFTVRGIGAHNSGHGTEKPAGAHGG